MNSIEIALQRADLDVRATCGHKWLIWANQGDSGGEWVVYYRKPYQKNSRSTWFGNDLGKAVDFLTSEED